MLFIEKSQSKVVKKLYYFCNNKLGAKCFKKKIYIYLQNSKNKKIKSKNGEHLSDKYHNPKQFNSVSFSNSYYSFF